MQALFVLIFALLAVRQLWIAVVEGPKLAENAHNPRAARLNDGRGSIFANDGTPIALTRAGHRVYPRGRLVAHAVGYASETYGTSGLEDSFDRVLRAPAASTDPLRAVRSLFGGTGTPPRGSDIITTLDLAVQTQLVRGLAAYHRGAGVVIDPRTGAVIALASQPSFDPNGLDRGFAALAHDPASALLDRSTSGLYPPGSTFKIVSAAMALEDGVVTPSSTFSDPGVLTVGDYVVHDDVGDVGGTGTQDLAGAFALSSNVDFAQIMLKLGVDRWEADAAKWRLGQPVDFDLPVSADRLPPRADISSGVLAQLGFGQASLLVTPLRMALVGATIAEGGRTPRPYLVRTIAGKETTLATTTETLAQPITDQTASEVATLMRAVVERGTGTVARLPNVAVAGKTGTATNPQGASHSWFVAFAPAAAPRIVVAVIVENVGYGATYAAPIARDVLRVALARRRT